MQNRSANAGKFKIFLVNIFYCAGEYFKNRKTGRFWKGILNKYFGKAWGLTGSYYIR